MHTDRSRLLCGFLAVLALVFLAPLSCSDEESPAGPSRDPECSVVPDELDFGTRAVGTLTDLTFTIKNTGGGTLAGDVAESCDHYSIVSGAGAFSLGGGDSVIVTVRFAPADEGTHDCAIATGSGSCGSVPCAGEAQFAWEQVYSNVNHDWYEIWGSSANDIWAVGYDLIHFDGSSWTVVTNPSDKTLYGIWGTAWNNIYAVGHDYFTDEGVIIHYDGAAWSIVLDDLPVGFIAVWGSGPNDIYAVGIGNDGYRYSGSSWGTVALGGVVTHDVWGTASNDVFVVGDTGRIRRWNGSDWNTMTTPISCALLGVWGASSSEVFVGSICSTILAYYGSGWEQMTIDGSAGRIDDIWGTSASDLYCVGTGGNIMRFDGSSWKDMICPTTQNLLGIWGTSASNIYAVGTNGVILRYTGQ